MRGRELYSESCGEVEVATDGGKGRQCSAVASFSCDVHTCVLACGRNERETKRDYSGRGINTEEVEWFEGTTFALYDANVFY